MVWDIPGAQANTTPMANIVKGDQRSMKDQLADLGLRARVRLDIPVTSQQALRDAAEEMFALANRLSVLGRRTDIPEKTALFQAAWDIKASHRKIQVIKPKRKDTMD